MSKLQILSLFMSVCAMSLFSPAYALDLSLNDVVEKIMAESHDLKKANANLKKAEASLDAANANRWFKLDGSASYMNMVNIENPSKSQQIELPPSLGGLISETLKDQSIIIEIPDELIMRPYDGKKEGPVLVYVKKSFRCFHLKKKWFLKTLNH